MRAFFQKRKSKKKLLIALCSVFLITALLLSLPLHYYNVFSEDIGIVNGIRVKRIDRDTLELRIKYQFPTGGYSVQSVSPDEGEYIGDGMIDYDGSLGKYRIMVRFGDIGTSTALSLKFLKEPVKLKSIPITLKAKVSKPEDHGFVLYIGSDTPISIEPVEYGAMNALRGTIKIPIAVGNK